MDIRIPKLVNQLEKIYNQLTLYDTPLQEIRTPTKQHLMKLQRIAQNIVDFISDYMNVEINTDTASADTVTTDDSDTSQDIYEILCNTEDYAMAAYNIGKQIQNKQKELENTLQDILLAVQYPNIEGLTQALSQALNNSLNQLQISIECTKIEEHTHTHTQTKSIQYK